MMVSSLWSLEEWDRLSSDEKQKVARDVEQRLPLFREFLLEEGSSSDDEDSNNKTVARGSEKEELHKGRRPIVFRGLKEFSAGDQKHEIATFSFSTTTTVEDETTVHEKNENETDDNNNETSTILLLIPGGKNVRLGYDPEMYEGFPSRNDLERYEKEYVQNMGFEPLSEIIEQSMSRERTVTLSPFLIDASSRIVHDHNCYEDLVESIKDSGWSLPSDEEWEWAYRGGTTLVYPWGSNTFEQGFNDVDRSAFGFEFPTSTYNTEFTDDDGFARRGGDGGVCECGGYTDFIWELIHACAHVSPIPDPDATHYRRVYRITDDDTAPVLLTSTEKTKTL